MSIDDQKKVNAAAKKAIKTVRKTAKNSAETRAEKRLRKHGPKAKFSFKRNVLPALAGIVVMLAVLGALNGQWIIAQMHYYSLSHRATTTNVTAATVEKHPDTKAPHPELGPRLTIPAIGVEAPVEFDQGTAEWQIQLALRKGVVHYDNSAKPGDIGNVAIFGHSSGQAWAPGNYKFIFTLLDKLKKDDIAYVDYNGTRYTYKVTSSQVVAPTDVGVLTSANDRELTLITCTPVGTSKNRLVVHAEQISPSPQKTAQTAAPAVTTTQAAPKELPAAASQSLWQTIKSWF